MPRERSDARSVIAEVPSKHAPKRRRRALRRRASRASFLKMLRLEQLEDRRLLAVVVGGPEDDVSALPIFDYGEPAPILDVTGSDLAYVSPLEDPSGAGEIIEVDLAADPQLADSGPLINLDDLRSDPRFAGINGDGFGSSGPIGVAIIDTGIDVDHPYLNFAGGTDIYHGDSNPNDYVGHGTHVAGIVGSTHGFYTGVAPGANLYGVKVFSDWGGSTPFYKIEQGLQWVIDNAAANNIQVVNMSLGSFSNLQEGATGNLDDEIAQLESMGVAVVSSSGNDYSYFDPVPGQAYPGVNSTLGVGATWTKDFNRSFFWSSGAIDFSTDTDRIVSFSQRDPNNSNHVMAPGALITSTFPGGGFRALAGTSMASPQVAGLVALLQDAAIEFGGSLLATDTIVDVIRSTATLINDGDDESDNVINTGLDYLRVDAYAAVEAIWDMYADIDEEPYPTPLEAKAPLGSMIYDPVVESRVNFLGDTDTYTIDVDAGQTISLVAAGGENLRPKLELYDPSGNLVASAAATEIGGDAVIQTAAVSVAGTYDVVVSGVDAGGTPDYDASLTQTDNVFYPNVLNFPFTGATAPGGDATLTVNVTADLGASSEYLTLEAEGLVSERLFQSNGREAQPASTSVSISRSDLEALAADGTINFTVTPSLGVDDFWWLQESLTLSLSYPGLPGGGTGIYELQLVLNSALEDENRGGPTNDSIATAQDIESSFISIARGADRGAVLGSLSPGDAQTGGLGRLFGYDAAADRVVEFDRDTGATVGVFSSPILEAFGPDFGMATTPNSVLLGGRDIEPIVEVDPDTGTVLRTIPNPGVNISGLAYLNDEIYVLTDFGTLITVLDYATGSVQRQFSARAVEGLAASADGLYGTGGTTFFSIDTNTGNSTILGSLAGSSFVEGIGIIGDELYVSNGFPDQILVYDLATLAPKRTFALPVSMDLEALGADGGEPGGPAGVDNGDVYAFRLEEGQLATLVTTDAGALGPVAFSASQTQTDNVHRGQTLTFRFDDAVAPAGPATLKVDALADLDLSFEYLVLDAEGVFSQQLFVTGGQQLSPVSTTISIPESVVAQLATDGTVEFTVTTSAAVDNLGRSSLTLDLSYPGQPLGGEVAVELLDADGNVLAAGHNDTSNVSQAIEDFRAPADGTYYARVTGSGAVDYSLVVTRGASFEVNPPAPEEETVSELITNGSFEDGSFSGWTVETTGTPFRPWQVTGGNRGGWSRIDRTDPQDGQYVAWNGFDGSGPMQFRMYQDVSIPSSASEASLSWMHRLQWDFGIGLPATQPRTLDVQLHDPVTGDVLETLFSFSTGTPPANTLGDTGWTTNVVDLADYAGQDLRIVFIENIPERSTGPGQAEFDAVSLMITEAPGVVSTTFDFEEFVPPPRLVSSLTTVSEGVTATITHENGVLFDVERRFNVQQYNSQFEFNSISAFNGRGGIFDPGAFIVDFSEPLAQVSVDMGDFGQDADNLQLIAYSGPGGTGQQLGSVTDLLPGANNTLFVFRTLTIAAPGIQSIKMIGGSQGGPNSVFYDNISIVTPPSEPPTPQSVDASGLVLGHVGADDDGDDLYTFTAAAGEQFSLHTLTPGDDPLEFSNALDPRIELVDPDGNVVASDDNSAADGRNARLVYTALAAGTYAVRVLPAGGSGGEYVLRLNHAPVVTDGDLSLASTSIDENGFASLSGSFIDPDAADAHTVTVDWGDGTVTNAVVDPQNLTFAAEHQYLDDGTTPGGSPSFVYPISVTVTDLEQLSDSAATDVTVNNRAPVITSISSDATLEDRADEGETVTVAADFTDVGTLDTHTATIDWGDGTGAEPVGVAQQAGGGSLQATHGYASGGIYTVTLTVTDDDTGEAVRTTTSVVIGAGVNRGVLQIVGRNTSDGDHVHVHLVGGGNGKNAGQSSVRVHADFLSSGQGADDIRDFPTGDITGMLVIMGVGDDHVTLAGNFDIDSTIYAGAGNDHVRGGAANDILLGGPGDDFLIGGHGDDLMIGGNGRDQLNGQQGNNLVDDNIFDAVDGDEDDPAVDLLNDLDLLEEIQNAWLAGEEEDALDLLNAALTDDGVEG